MWRSSCKSAGHSTTKHCFCASFHCMQLPRQGLCCCCMRLPPSREHLRSVQIRRTARELACVWPSHNGSPAPTGAPVAPRGLCEAWLRRLALQILYEPIDSRPARGTFPHPVPTVTPFSRQTIAADRRPYVCSPTTAAPKFRRALQPHTLVSSRVRICLYAVNVSLGLYNLHFGIRIYVSGRSIVFDPHLRLVCRRLTSCVGVNFSWSWNSPGLHIVRRNAVRTPASLVILRNPMWLSRLYLIQTTAKSAELLCASNDCVVCSHTDVTEILLV